MITHLLLDFDGTLFDTEPVALPSLIARFNELFAAELRAGGHKPLTLAGFMRDFHGLSRQSLAAALERQVRCVSLQDTKLELAVDRGLMTSAEILRDLRSVLREVTSVAWDIREVAGAGGEGVNLAKVEEAKAEARIEAATTDPLVADLMGMFPGAKIESVEDTNA